MPFNDSSIRTRLKAFDFTNLFVEDLGWDRKQLTLPIEVAGHAYTLRSHVHKAGLTVFECPPGPDGRIPDYPIRRQIERKVAKVFVEHLIIFTDTQKTTQVWQWMKRGKDKPVQSREHTCHPSNPGPLVQKLQRLQFTLDEELQGISIVHATGRTRDAFDVEKVTKRFYEAFRKEHASFLGEILGFPPALKGKEGKKEPHPDLQWYTSLTLNRLMFVYFIQKKRFLDGDPDYLQNRLKAVREKKGKDKFHSFYRLFLLHLFHEGLGKQQAERDPELARLIGNVPYLNGGFFEVHQLERDYPDIDIPDKAFQRLFAFFDGWDWVLDTRAPRDLSNVRDRKDEINPDVVGYIFEKYINQKQMGAYYTKEDITGYITQNTVIPFILDAAAKDCAVAFQPGGFVWKLLQDNPDRYIYEPVRRGVIDGTGNVIPLPPEIEAGIADIPKRAGWNKPAPAPYALPTETWREHVARRQRCLDLRGKLSKGEVHTVNDLITHNLDIRQFAQDIITHCDGPELLRALWQPIQSVTILDPTCGSGAFLFAALNLLEPLYAGCLDKMQAFLDEAARLSDTKRLARLDDFRQTLNAIAKHANEDYFVLKSIIVSNLYGVDIMEEAVEICRLRLFLKLVSTVTDVKHIEPLPDIDFNVRAGNTLVGYATKAQSQDNLNFGGAIDRIEEKAKVMELNWQKFKDSQTQGTYSAALARAMKAAILKPLGELREELDALLAVACGQAGKDELPAFRKSHQPFHWWIEFYGIMNDGGFDVVVGNPPYVSTTKIDYFSKAAKALKLPDLYAHVLLRSLTLSGEAVRFGMIVPLSLTFSEDFGSLRKTLTSTGGAWFSSFDNIPAALFAGVSQRCTIWIGDRGKREAYSSPMYRWRSVTRAQLVANVAYVSIHRSDFSAFGIPKVGSQPSVSLLEQLANRPSMTTRSFVVPSRAGKHWIRYSQTARNFVSVFKTDPPYLEEHGLKPVPSSKIGEVAVSQADDVFTALAGISGELYFWYWLTRGDGFDVTGWIIADYLRAFESVPPGHLHLMNELGKILHSRRFEALAFKKNAGKYVGNFNFRGHSWLTRRADLVMLAGLGVGRDVAIEVFSHVQRVLAINEFAGEKSIPPEVKAKYKPQRPDEAAEGRVLRDADKLIKAHFAFTDDELDYLYHHDVTYRSGESDE